MNIYYETALHCGKSICRMKLRITFQPKQSDLSRAHFLGGCECSDLGAGDLAEAVADPAAVRPGHTRQSAHAVVLVSLSTAAPSPVLQAAELVVLQLHIWRHDGMRGFTAAGAEARETSAYYPGYSSSLSALY